MIDQKQVSPMGPKQNMMQVVPSPMCYPRPIVQAYPPNMMYPNLAEDINKYASTNDEDFRWALEELKDSNRVTRGDWYEGTFIVLIDGSEDYELKPNGRFSSLLEGINEERVDFPQHIVMYIGHKNIVIDWVPTQLDILVDDWGMCDGKHH